MNMATKINKEVFVNLIIDLQRAYKLPQSRQETLMLFDERMLSQQLATVLKTIDSKTPNSFASDGAGDFGINVLDKAAIADINRNHLVRAALGKLDKETLISFTLKLIHQNSNQKKSIIDNHKFQRSNSVNL
jgi:hypothetical protein